MTLFGGRLRAYFPHDGLPNILALVLFILPMVWCAHAHAKFRTDVVSLAPNLTEIVYALGAQDRLAGITEQCDHPSVVRALPKIGDFASPSLERIIQTRARVVLATEGNPRDILTRLKARGVSIVEAHPKTASELPAAVRTIGEALGVPDRAQDLVARIEAALKSLPGPNAKGPRALVALQFDPIYSVSDATWLGDLFKRSGFTNVAGDSPVTYPVVSREALIAAKPGIVFVTGQWSSDRAFDQRKETHLAEASLRKIYGIKAVLPRIVVLPPDVFVRPGPRIVDAISFLKAHPEWMNP